MVKAVLSGTAVEIVTVQLACLEHYNIHALYSMSVTYVTADVIRLSVST